MLKFNIITLFPDLFAQHLNTLPFKKAIENKLIEVNLINLRNFALDSYGTVDDKTYGGGVGMVLMIEPIFKALQTLNSKTDAQTKTILLSPTGKTFNQSIAQNYANISEITLICGRYEGIDYRVEEHLADEVLSIGDYVVSGGELPALVLMEAVTRLIPGVLEKAEAAANESFSQDNSLEYPQYTRPENFNGWKVPDILLSGNHKAIEEWRKKNSKKSTDK